MNTLPINVYSVDKREVLPVCLSKSDSDRVINLLMIPVKSEESADDQILFFFSLSRRV